MFNTQGDAWVHFAGGDIRLRRRYGAVKSKQNPGGQRRRRPTKRDVQYAVLKLVLFGDR